MAERSEVDLKKHLRKFEMQVIVYNILLFLKAEIFSSLFIRYLPKRVVISYRSGPLVSYPFLFAQYQIAGRT